MKVETIEKRACEAFVNTFNEAHAEGGFLELNDKAREAKQGLSQHIYGLAVQIDKDGKNVDVFLEACKAAERKMKDELNIGSIKDELPPWTQFKSNIKAAWKAGIRPGQFPNEQKQRQALQEARKAEKDASEGSAPSETGESQSQTEGTTIPKELAQPLEEMIRLAEQAGPAGGKDLVDRLADIYRDAAHQAQDAVADLIGDNQPVARKSKKSA